MPIKLEKLAEYLENNRVRSSLQEFQNLVLDLEWTPDQGLSGTCVIELMDDDLGTNASFDSNLIFSDLNCLDR